MQDVKEEVRSRLNIEDVIGEYVPLKRAGRNFKGLSPFQTERTPSFVVSPDKQIWHDFSSNKGGDVFSFVMEVEGIDFRAALELLARKAGIDLSMYQTGDNKGLAQKRQRLLSVLDLAATYYQHSLLKNQRALEYVFKKRGLSKEIVQTFRIGYAPQADTALKDFLIKKGFKQDELKDAGLLSQRRSGLSDMFRGRMMVPLADGQGQVVGFTARLIENIEGAPKYINTPQTILYDKGRQAFGLHLAKESIRKNDYAVVVEGNLDVVSSHQAGITQVVAAAGTALTEYHLKSLSRLTNNVRLAFDADAAGIAATERAIGIAEAAGVRLSIISLPDELKDPDEAIQKDPVIWQSAIEQAEPVIDWLIARYAGLFDPASAEGKRQISSKALEVITNLKDAVEQEHYLGVVAKVTGASTDALKEKLSTIKSGPAEPPKRSIAQSSQQSGRDEYAYQDSLLSLAASYPETRPVLDRLTDLSCLHGEQRQQLAAYLKDHPVQRIDDTVPRDLRTIETYVKIIVVRAEERYGEWNDQDRYVEAAKLARDVVNEQKRNRKTALIAKLREAEAAGDDSLAGDLRAELNSLIRER